MLLCSLQPHAQMDKINSGMTSGELGQLVKITSKCRLSATLLPIKSVGGTGKNNLPFIHMTICNTDEGHLKGKFPQTTMWIG